MIGLRRATSGRAPALPPDKLIEELRAWRERRDAEWRSTMRRYQEAVSAFRRVVEIAERRAYGATRGRVPGPAAAARPPRWPQLTERQGEIAQLIAVGMTNRQIASALVLTEGTVANHIRHILLRLGVRCRAQVAAWVVAGGGAGAGVWKAGAARSP
ncbi:MAG TPA: LuxR C-terminal-related transcriptional regulator [Chloroflexota bacterium]|jgi:DNA-binding NarL/FixJ family response regulator|nr:LuxR C-terminal-related transcriptional regulator [Chloroflexota bacterium]